MKKSFLTFLKSSESAWHTIFKNNHGRRLYFRINISDKNIVTICDCFYIDRPINNGVRSVPLKQKTRRCHYENLLDVLEMELDKKFYGVEFVDSEAVFSTDKYIEAFLNAKKKHKFLILVESGNVLKTRLKNRTHRVIFLEIKRNDTNALVSNCYYCDRVYKRDKSLITPAGLTSVYFEYNLNTILEIVNEELNCDFTDVIVTKDTFDFDKTELPLCGSI